MLDWIEYLGLEWEPKLGKIIRAGSKTQLLEV